MNRFEKLNITNSKNKNKPLEANFENLCCKIWNDLREN